MTFSALTLSRAASLLHGDLDRQRKRTDRMFAWLMGAQWLATVSAAVWLSPRAWAGATSSVNPHVWIAIVLGGVATLFPVYRVWRYPGTRLTRHVVAFGQMIASALLALSLLRRSKPARQ